MEIRMGEKIRALRKRRNISQEVLAQYLGVSFQAVSKWENGAAMPDVAMIPAIASFFDVSTDELFDFNRLDTEKRVYDIVWAAADKRVDEPGEAERILREGLKKYPGNDILLNNLLYVLDAPERRDELVTICRSLIEATRDDAVKYDACRILAETYAGMGEYELCRQTLEMIPEIYFTKLELQALLLKGEERLSAARAQRSLAAETLADMLICLAEYYEESGDAELARNKLETAKNVILALKDERGDAPDGSTYYSRHGARALEKLERRLKDEGR